MDLDEGEISGAAISIAERERTFHNKRFMQEEDRSQGKYYFSIDEGRQLFHSYVEILAKSADVLEYGCSVGTTSLQLAAIAKSVCGIDISDVAIAKAREQALPNTQFFVMDALNLEFEDHSFDLVFGSGIIHHLDVEAAGREIRRVLRPGGTAIFWEPLGHNPIINLYRWATPSARTADEHPLLRHHILGLNETFSRVDVTHFGFFTLAAVPIRKTPLGNGVRHFLEKMDKVFFALGPSKWMSWYVLIKLIA